MSTVTPKAARWAGLVLAGVWASAAIALSASPAAAHDELTAVDPPVGAVLDTPPPTAVFTYSQPVTPEFVQAGLTPPGGVEVPLGPEQLLVDSETVTVPLAGVWPTPAGLWTVVVRVVGDDGHPVVSTLTFTAGAADSTPPAVTPLDAAGTAAPSVVAPDPLATRTATENGTAATAAEDSTAVTAATTGGMSRGAVTALVLGAVVVIGGAGAVVLATRG